MKSCENHSFFSFFVIVKLYLRSNGIILTSIYLISFTINSSMHVSIHVPKAGKKERNVHITDSCKKYNFHVYNLNIWDQPSAGILFFFSHFQIDNTKSKDDTDLHMQWIQSFCHVSFFFYTMNDSKCNPFAKYFLPNAWKRKKKAIKRERQQQQQQKEEKKTHAAKTFNTFLMKYNIDNKNSFFFIIIFFGLLSSNESYCPFRGSVWLS